MVRACSPAVATSCRPTSTSAQACWTASTCRPCTSCDLGDLGSLRFDAEWRLPADQQDHAHSRWRHLRLRRTVRIHLPDRESGMAAQRCALRWDLPSSDVTVNRDLAVHGRREARQQRFEPAVAGIGAGCAGHLPREDAGGELPGSGRHAGMPASTCRCAAASTTCSTGIRRWHRPTSSRAARRTTTSSTTALAGRYSWRDGEVLIVTHG